MKLRSHLYWRQKLIQAFAAGGAQHDHATTQPPLREEDAWLGIG